MRQHVLQVGKSQDRYHGIMEKRRILLEPPPGGGLVYYLVFELRWPTEGL